MFPPPTHRTPRRLLAVLFVAFVIGGSILVPRIIHADDQRFAEIDTYIADLMDSYQVPGAAIALVKDGQVIYSHGYGVRDSRNQLPVTENTVFAIGSISKSFTALAITQLADAGKLNLDDPVVKYLPEFKLSDAWATNHLTIRELLSQTSGLPRADDLWLPDAPASRKQIVGDLVKVNLTAVPGGEFQYSNQNYVVLGYLVERITGQSWEAYVQSHILTPLGMNSASFGYDMLQAAADHADPHILDGKLGLMPVGLSSVETQWLRTHGPAVSINADVLDMAKYATFQLGNGTVDGQEIVSTSMLDDMHRPEVSLAPLVPLVNREGYGMGWFTETYRGLQLVEHSGDVKGFAANITLVPAQKIGIVMLTNIQVMEAFRQAVRLRLLESLAGLSPTDNVGKAIDNLDKADLLERKSDFETARTFRLPPATLVKLAGDYDGDFGRVHITLSDGRLFARPQGWAVIYEVAPFAADKVLYSPGTLSGSRVLTFKIDGQGRVAFYQGNNRVMVRLGG